MDGDPDAVTEAMPERLAIAGAVNDGARESVDFAAGHASAGGGLRGLLSSEHDVIDLAELAAGLAEHERPCDVAAIAIVQGAHVDDDAVAELEAAVARLVVGLRAIGTRGDDGVERKSVGAKLAHAPLELPCNGPLGESGMERCAHGLHGLVGEVDGPLNRGDFAGLLDGAELARHRAGGDELGRRLNVAQLLVQHGVRLERHRAVFDANAPRPGRSDRVLEPSIAAGDADNPVVGGFYAGLLGIPEVGSEHLIAGGDPEIARRPAEPGEVGPVLG